MTNRSISRSNACRTIGPGWSRPWACETVSADAAMGSVLARTSDGWTSASKKVAIKSSVSDRNARGTIVSPRVKTRIPQHFLESITFRTARSGRKCEG